MPADRGFSLLELLVVIGVVLVLVAMVVPTIGRMNEGLNLTRAGNQVVDAINHARSVALTRSQPVEVWFLRLASTEGGDDVAYRAIQSRVLAADGTTEWIARMQRLPESTIISSSQARSNVIGRQSPQAVADTPDVVVDGVGIRIYPSGRAEVVSPSASMGLTEPLFFTIGHERDVGDDGTTMPGNFFAVQIDPRNGRVTSLRP